jgi:hypothetical protein
MVDLSNYPYLAYEPSKAAAGTLAILIGISLIAWIVQSVQSHFQPSRLIIFLLLSHLTTMVNLVLRAALPSTTRNSKFIFMFMTILLAGGQRLIILGNYNFLIQLRGTQSWFSRTITIEILLGAIGSAALLAPVTLLSYDTNTIDKSFLLRQISAAIILCMTVLFYPVWYATKTTEDMTKKGIILLVISSLTCMVVAIFLLVTSLPDYYVVASEQEFWFYIFQLTPIALTQFIWTILHPRRSLQSTSQQQE